ncbi:MAG: isoprenylcysteine carboxylmethyltransferase family protein [Candidatus Binatia bacterium]
MRTMRRCLVPMGHFFFSARNILFPLTFIGLLVLTQPEFPYGSELGDWWLDLCGLVVVLSGQACRALAIGQAENIRRGGRGKRVAAKRLINHGIYAHTRNPLYLGNLLIIGGLGLIANNYWWYLIALPVFVGVYWSIVFAEEGFLLRQFGQEYVAYYQSVNRFLPRLSGLDRSCRQGAFDWKRVFRKEYSIACSWMAMAIILLIWEQWEGFGYVARRTEIQELSFLLLSVFVLYVGIVGWRIRGKALSEKTSSREP